MPSFLDPEWMETPPDREPPAEGWHKPCDFADHRWVLDVEDGRACVRCADPCDPNVYDLAGRTPTCLCDWQPEDFHTPEPLPVVLTYVDDSTPSTPAGPAEYGYYIEVRATAFSTSRSSGEA